MMSPIHAPRLALVALYLVALCSLAHAQSVTLDAGKTRSAIRCGTSTGFPGFSMPDSMRACTGLDQQARFQSLSRGRTHDLAASGL